MMNININEKILHILLTVLHYDLHNNVGHNAAIDLTLLI